MSDEENTVDLKIVEETPECEQAQAELTQADKDEAEAMEKCQDIMGTASIIQKSINGAASLVMTNFPDAMGQVHVKLAEAGFWIEQGVKSKINGIQDEFYEKYPERRQDDSPVTDDSE